MLLADIAQYFFGFTIFLVSVFMILLILVQRGRGGGLVGALGGPGGQSAFGTKAGDLFTRITIVTAAVWIVLLAAAAYTLKEKDLPETGVVGDIGPSLTDPNASKSGAGAGADPATPPATSGAVPPVATTPPAAETPAASPGTTPAASETPAATAPVAPAAETPAAPAVTPPATTPPAAPPAAETPAPETPAGSGATPPATGSGN